MKISCSVPILTLNSRKTLGRLLPILSAAFDDVFIVDGNSTDGTEDYARSLGVRVEKQFDHDVPDSRITHFANMRERSWGMAHHDWIFWIDADEIPGTLILERVNEIVQEGKTHELHAFLRKTQLPNGNVVEHALYYPEYVPRLFRKTSGLHLVDRAVHEKFAIPPNVNLVRHDEALYAPWGTAEEMWKRQSIYVELDSVADEGTAAHLLRWIILYNLRSLLGQTVRAIRATLIGFLRRETALPWAYNWSFLRYRVSRMHKGTIVWSHRRHRAGSEKSAETPRVG